jgi:MFS family permease
MSDRHGRHVYRASGGTALRLGHAPAATGGVTGAAAETAPDPARWRVLGLVSLGVVLTMTPWFSATAVVPELTELWALTGGEAAWMTIAVQVGFVTGAVVASLINLPDVVSLRRLMAVSAALAAVANATLVIAPTPLVAILARLATGVLLAGVYPPALKLLATWFVAGRGLALGSAIGALTLGSALPHLVRATAPLDWRIVVAATSVATIAGAALFARFAHDGPHAYARAVFDPRQIGRLLRNRGLVLASLGYFGHMWELYAMWGWFHAYSRAALAVQGRDGDAAASLVTFVAIAAGVVGCVGGGVLSDRLGRTPTTAGMMAVSGLCAVLIGFVFEGPFILYVCLAVVWGVSVIGDSPQFSTMVTALSDRRLVGTALTLQFGIGFALTIGAIWLIPSVAATAGSWQWVFLVLVPGPTIGVAAMLALRGLPEARLLAGGKG